MKQQLNGLKPVQITELEAEFEKVAEAGKARPERYLRYVDENLVHKSGGSLRILFCFVSPDLKCQRRELEGEMTPMAAAEEKLLAGEVMTGKKKTRPWIRMSSWIP